MFRTRNRRAVVDAAPWSRVRLQLMLGGLALAVVVAVVGGGLAVWRAVVHDGPPAPVATGPHETLTAADQPSRDDIAAAAMPAVDSQAPFHPDPATTPAASIVVPQPSILDGPAGVPSGFPHTSEGAVGQWAAIAQTVLESMSLPRTREVHAAWVPPGGPGFERWTLTRNVTSFLAAARQAGDEKDLTTVVSAAPAAGLVKGSDGPDWAVVCVLLDVQAWITAESRMGYGLCSRMQWVEGRWQVATGAEPAPAPSAWPGSNAAVAAGWLAWRDGEVR
ncbi:MAG: hypothetical protein IT193_02185 [Propionibacteriaceae bacterium]|nr:hypothetical protein [Propionibacteriaceae bacterium]